MKSKSIRITLSLVNVAKNKHKRRRKLKNCKKLSETRKI